MKAFQAIVSLVAAAACIQSVQGKTSPTYFVAPSGVADGAGCKAFAAQNPQVGNTGPIFTGPGETTICIYFPDHDVWRRDTGSQGNCRGTCCEWFPPSAKDGTPALKTPPPSISWFASLDGTCNNEAAAEVSPWIFTNAPAGSYQVCMKPRAGDNIVPGFEEKFTLVPVDSMKCGGENGRCCPFTFQKGFKPPFFVEPKQQQ